MRIKELTIENYRNLSGVTITFNSQMNFIIGNNGVGKSNIVELIDILFNRNSFDQKDFFDAEQKIKIYLSLELEDSESGYFEDLFEPENDRIIKILASQDSPNSRIEYQHYFSNTPIPYSRIRSIPCVYYNTVKSSEEINFNKSKNSGKFLNFIIEKYIEDNEVNSDDIIKKDKILEIINYMDNCIYNINIIKKNKVKVRIDNDATELLPKLLGLGNDNNISINNMGSGIQYISFVFFEILNTIVNNIKFYNGKNIITTENGEKRLSIIILLDEPEIHLHPYMQRSLIKQIRDIIDNNNRGFNKLLKDWFDIDGILGQVIIVTHSNNIISNNYREYIRMFNENEKVNVISANNLKLSNDIEKQLLREGIYIKEAFFSKAVLVFEGITEKSFIESFADKNRIDLDGDNVGVIAADGANNVPKIKEVLEQFKIRTVCIVDRDKKSETFEKAGILFTTDNDFELDIINQLISKKATKKTIKIIHEYDNKHLKSILIQSKAIESAIKHTKENIEIKNYNVKEAIMSNDAKVIKNVLYSWMSSRKDMIRGRILGEVLDLEDIPSIYISAIDKARRMANE